MGPFLHWKDNTVKTNFRDESWCFGLGTPLLQELSPSCMFCSFFKAPLFTSTRQSAIMSVCHPTWIIIPTPFFLLPFDAALQHYNEIRMPLRRHMLAVFSWEMHILGSSTSTMQDQSHDHKHQVACQIKTYISLGLFLNPLWKKNPNQINYLQCDSIVSFKNILKWQWQNQ